MITKKHLVPLISFIIPVYNADKFVSELFESIISQIENQNVEIIIVNDGSKDQSKTIIDTFAEKYRFIKGFHLPNQGVYKSRNFALDQVCGQFIWMLDADDIILPNTLSKIFKTLNEGNDLDILNVAYQIENADQSIVTMVPPITNKLINGLDFLEANDGRLFLWNTIYNHEFLIKNKLRFLGKSHSLEDSLFNLKAFTYAQKVWCLDMPTYFYRFNANSISKKPTLENRLKQGQSSMNVHFETQKFQSLYAIDSREYNVLKYKLMHSVTGFFFSLLKESYPISYVKEVYKSYKTHKFLPLKNKTKSLKLLLFEAMVNLKYPYFLMCKTQHFMRSKK